MDLLNSLNSPSSNLGLRGATPSINPGATQQSKLHASGNQKGYSPAGNFQPEVNTANGEYDDGVLNILPLPSQLDGADTPTQYVNNLPG